MEHSKRVRNAVLFPIIVLIILWSIKLYEYISYDNLSDLGILPRNFRGLQGIIFSPFLHGSFNHLINNSVSFFILGVMMFYFYPKTSWRVFTFGTLLIGFITWLIADLSQSNPSYQIGLSGVIYMMALYLFFGGVFKKNIRLMAVSLLVAFFYGGMLWGVLPLEFWEKQHISWEGHLSGAIAGITMAFINKNTAEIPLFPERTYSWQKHDDLDENEPYWMPGYFEQKQKEDEERLRKLQEEENNSLFFTILYQENDTSSNQIN